MVGARAFHVVDRWDLYADDPVRVLDLSRGGLAVYGGLIGGALTALFYGLWKGLPVWRLGDAAAPAMLLGQAVGRLACIPNGDALGSKTDLPWAFIYTNPRSMVPPDLLGVATHPYAAYEILLNLTLLALLWRLRSVFKVDGLLFLTYVLAYSGGRFFLSYLRVEKTWLWGLQEAQVVALVLVVSAALLFACRIAGAAVLGTRPSDSAAASA
jgi:phosphatidylglycerol---prolipoprotein diacylglyceryl transferase